MKISDLKEFIKKNGSRSVIFLSFVFLLSLIPYPNTYFRTIKEIGGIVKPEKIELPKAPPIPIRITLVDPQLVSASGVYILDLPSNVVMYEKNKKLRFLPASTTKIATALVALDKYNPDDVLTVKTIVGNGRTMGLVQNEKITFESLLYGSLVHSANDASYTIAENYPGGVEAFVVMMNKKATELNLSDTHFNNPIGFDDDENYTTPQDLAKLAKYALNNKLFTKIVGTRSITVSDSTYTYFHDLRNVNELLGKVSGVSGVKTGFTDNAREVLVTEVKKNGRAVLFVVLKSQDRFGDTEKLINWVFGNFEWKDIETITPIPR